MSTRHTLPLSGSVAHTAPPPIAMSTRNPASSVSRRATAFVALSISVTVLPSVTQTSPSPAAMFSARTFLTRATIRFDRGSMRETVRSGLITQTASGATAMCCRLLPGNTFAGPPIRAGGSSIVSTRRPDSGSTRNTLLGMTPPADVVLPIQTPPAPTAMSVGVEEVLKVRTTARVSGSICDTVLSSASSTQTPPSPTLTADGAVPSGTLATTSPETGSSARTPASSTTRVAASGLVGGRSDRDSEQEHADRHDRPRLPPQRSRPCSQPRRRLRRGERRVLVEDLTLEPPQVLARLEAELLRERAASLLVGLQRLRLPTRAVEGEHQLPPGPFAQRMLDDERLELDDELLVASELEIGLDPLLLGGEAELVEARDLGLSEVRVSELRQRGAAPERERLPQLLRRRARAHRARERAVRPRASPERCLRRARRSRGGGGSRGHATRALHRPSPASLAAVRRAPAASSARTREASRPRARR